MRSVRSAERVYAALTAAPPFAELNTACRTRTATLGAILNSLTADGTVRKTPAR